MEDVSDPPFRALCKEQGADVVYTEFISSEGLIREAAKSTMKLDIYEKYESDLIIDNVEKQKAEIEKLEAEKSDVAELKLEMKELRNLLIKRGNPENDIEYYDLVDSESYKIKKKLVERYERRELKDA